MTKSITDKSQNWILALFLVEQFYFLVLCFLIFLLKKEGMGDER